MVCLCGMECGIAVAPFFFFPPRSHLPFFFGRLLWLASFANGVVVLKVGGCCLIVSVRRYGWDVLEKYFMGGRGGVVSCSLLHISF